MASFKTIGWLFNKSNRILDTCLLLSRRETVVSKYLLINHWVEMVYLFRGKISALWWHHRIWMNARKCTCRRGCFKSTPREHSWGSVDPGVCLLSWGNHLYSRRPPTRLRWGVNLHSSRSHHTIKHSGVQIKKSYRPGRSYSRKNQVPSPNRRYWCS